MTQKRCFVQALFLQAAAVAVCLTSWALGLSSPISLYFSSGIFTVLGAVSAFLLFRKLGVLAPVGFYFLGSTVYFGIGALIAIEQNVYYDAISFGADVQGLYMPKVNVINSIAAFIVLAVAYIFTWDVLDREQGQEGVAWVLSALSKFSGMLVILCIFGLFVKSVTFPAAESGFIRTFVKLFTPAQLLFILVSGARWGESSATIKMLALVVCIGMFMFGVLYISKTEILLPAIVFAVGLMMSSRNKNLGFVFAIFLIIIYFLFIAPFVAFARLHVLYDPALNTINDRIIIIRDIIWDFRALIEIADSDKVLRRFSVVPFQAAFMAFYDGGMPGSSIVDGAYNLIPRIFWPEKPFFDPGLQFNLVFYNYEGISSLAISYLGEAYWNYGWLGVILAPFVMAISVGWFTRRWLLFVLHGRPYIGAFIFSPLIAWSSNAVEANVIGGLIAGPIRLIVLIIVLDLIVRAYRDVMQIIGASYRE